MTSVVPAAPSPLDGLRIVEIPGPLGMYAGKLLADLGAEVILVEPPDGAEQRRQGPFLEMDDPAGEEGRAPRHSLSFAYFNTSKDSVVLDLDDSTDRDTFLALADTADAVLEGAGRLPWLVGRGLGPDALRSRNPRLVYTSVSPYGSGGPWADLAATDTTVLALSGFLSLGGYADGEPVRAFGDQAYLAAGQFAAVGTMLALLSAEESGTGQFVDVSAQQCCVMAAENAVQFYDLEHTVRRRNGGDPRQAGVGLYACADGFVYMLANGLGLFWTPMVDWLVEWAVPGAESLRDAKWESVEFAASREGKDEFLSIVGPFLQSRTKAELYDDARRIRIPLCPVNDPADLVANPHLQARGYLVEVEHPESGQVLTMPGHPYQLSGSPARVRRSAPQLGEHSAEFYLAAATTAAAPAERD